MLSQIENINEKNGLFIFIPIVSHYDIGVESFQITVK